MKSHTVSRLFMMPMLAALLCGCHAPGSSRPSDAQSIQAVASRILHGFDDLNTDGGLSAGDEAMYRVDIIRGTAVETSFLRVRLHDTDLTNISLVRVNPRGVASSSPTERIVTDPDCGTYDLKPMTWEYGYTPEPKKGEKEKPKKRYVMSSDSALAWIGLYGSDGALQGSRFIMLPSRALQSGFFQPALYNAIKRGSDPMTREMEDAWYPAAVDMQASLNALTTIVISTPLLNPIINEFIPFWVKLTALFRGISLSLSINEIEPFRDRVSDVPVSFSAESSRTNFVLSSNKSPIVSAWLIGAKPKSPLDAAAGLLEMEGVSMADPTRKFRIRLLAAKRGKMTTTQPGE